MTAESELNPQDYLSCIDEWKERFANRNMPRDFFPILHSMAEYLRVSGQARRAAELLECEATMGVERFIGHRLEHARQLVLALYEAGEKEKARPIVEYYAARPYLFDDMKKLGFFLFCRGTQALEEHDAVSLAYCVTLLAHTQAGTQDAYLLRIIHQAGDLRRLFAVAEGLDSPTRMLLFVLWGMPQFVGKSVAAGVFGRGLHLCLSMVRTVWRPKGGKQTWMLWRHASASASQPGSQGEKDTRPILVTRAMGGIGDILMMTPGLAALHHKYPKREIHFAVPKGFHSLLAHNPDVVPQDINGGLLRREEYFALYNMTECPASRVETATLPHNQRNRIDIFGAAMGISEKEMDSLGHKLFYRVSEEEKTWAEAFFAERGLIPGKCIAVHPHAADSYKDYPHMEELVSLLADERPVLVFHNSALRGFNYPRVFKVDTYPLRQSLAILSLCEKLIAVDSSFVHAAAALGIQTIALFGPTGGDVFAKHYNLCTTLSGYDKVGCKTCWRNSFVLCGKRKGNASACLYAIPSGTVLKECIN